VVIPIAITILITILIAITITTHAVLRDERATARFPSRGSRSMRSVLAARICCLR
jgi:hypothetical protein